MSCVEDLEIGDIVWTVDALGRRLVVAFLKTGHVSAPAAHEIIRLLLEDGCQTDASPGHPLPDSRRFKDWRIGDIADGSQILNIEYMMFEAEVTYDILPSGDTGWYWKMIYCLPAHSFFQMPIDKRSKLQDSQPLPIA